MSYVRGEDRRRAALLTAVIEDYAVVDAPVRVIDAFVDGLDVNGLGFGRLVPAATWRPPYDPLALDFKAIADFRRDNGSTAHTVCIRRSFCFNYCSF